MGSEGSFSVWGVLCFLVNLLASGVNIYLLVKNFKKPSGVLKPMFVVLQGVFGAIGMVFGRGLGYFLTKVFFAAMCQLLDMNVVKLIWIISVIFDVIMFGSLISQMAGGA